MKTQKDKEILTMLRDEIHAIVRDEIKKYMESKKKKPSAYDLSQITFSRKSKLK